MAEVDRLLKKLPAADPSLGRPSGGERTVRKTAAVPGGGWSSGAVPTARDRIGTWAKVALGVLVGIGIAPGVWPYSHGCGLRLIFYLLGVRSEEHTSELQSRLHLGCRLLLEKNNICVAHRGLQPNRRFWRLPRCCCTRRRRL